MLLVCCVKCVLKSVVSLCVLIKRKRVFALLQLSLNEKWNKNLNFSFNAVTSS